ncbi:hypothetical protein [Shouchella patagoniensis]|uniref:hypothetical protein n=1 Tax=Shouchella patagoniensis TaxID=228576 RepID=UPI000995BE70|nr:hypothetical protein [Shouchella patagoniensis]
MRTKSIYKLMDALPTLFQNRDFFVGKRYVRTSEGNGLQQPLIQLPDDSAEVCAEIILFMLDLEESS